MPLAPTDLIGMTLSAAEIEMVLMDLALAQTQRALLSAKIRAQAIEAQEGAVDRPDGLDAAVT